MVAPAMIKEQMEVLGSDGVHVGTVDHLEGRDLVKLTKDDPDAGGEHHFIPLAWVDHVDVHGSPEAIRRRGEGALEDALRSIHSEDRPRGHCGARGRCLLVDC